MDEKLVNDIKAIVDSIFSEKEKASQMQKTQDALNESAETIDRLTQALEELNKTSEDKQTSVAKELQDKDSAIASLTTELEAARIKLAEAEAEVVTTKASLEGIKKDQLAEARISDLKENKVATLNDIVNQTAKVREMTEEEFASYKQERVSLRQAVEKELAESLERAANTAPTNTPAVTPDASNTPPANVSNDQSAAAALNFESSSSTDLTAKYIELGKALAEELKKSDLKATK